MKLVKIGVVFVVIVMFFYVLCVFIWFVFFELFM